MIEALIGILFGMLLAVVGILVWRSRGGGSRRGHGDVVVHSSIEKMRALGELSVFKVITKEIVSADKHFFGPKGKKYFNWMVSSKKMAMILTFDIDFRYDLRSSEFEIHRVEGSERAYRVKMPKCVYDTHIIDMRIYDEQSSQFLPALMPDILSRVFGSGFSEDDKNELIIEAKHQAGEQAKRLVEQMRGEVQKSARQTLNALATGFGAQSVSFDFDAAKLIQHAVHYQEGAGVDGDKASRTTVDA